MTCHVTNSEQPRRRLLCRRNSSLQLVVTRHPLVVRRPTSVVCRASIVSRRELTIYMQLGKISDGLSMNCLYFDNFRHHPYGFSPAFIVVEVLSWQLIIRMSWLIITSCSRPLSQGFENSSPTK